MEFVPSGKELSHFPFLKKAQDPIRSRFASLGTLLGTQKGHTLVSHAVVRIKEAVSQKKTRAPEVHDSPEDEIAAYALARIIVSCVNDKQLIDRLTRHEAERAYYFLVNEEEWNSRYVQDGGEYSRLWVAIADEMGIRITQDRMPVPDYVELVAPLHDDRYRLVNRRVERGVVAIDKNERYELLRERIRVLLRRDLPHRVPKEVCEQLAPKAAEIKKIYQEQMLRQFGKVEEGAFPPCMQALITALAAGTNLTHAGRFSLTAFLHNIGMNTTGSRSLYARSRTSMSRRPCTRSSISPGAEGRGPNIRPPHAPRCRQPASVSTAMHSANVSVTRSVTTRQKNHGSPGACPCRRIKDRNPTAILTLLKRFKIADSFRLFSR